MKKFTPAAIATSACCGSEFADMMTSGFTNVEQVHGGPTALQKLRGGLEVILSWSKKYVADHGFIGAGESLPATETKNELIEATTSEGRR